MREHHQSELYRHDGWCWKCSCGEAHKNYPSREAASAARDNHLMRTNTLIDLEPPAGLPSESGER